MTESKDTLTELRRLLAEWEALLASKTEAEIMTPAAGSDWSIKDVIGHLRAWQQVSIARMEAGKSGSEPIFPDWSGGQNPDAYDNPQDLNDRIYTIYHPQPWSQVYTAWHDGFVHFLELGESIPPHTRGDKEKFPWLYGNSLDDVLYWSGDHHQEHLDVLLGKHKDSIS